MEPPAFWRDLQAQFRALPNAADLHAMDMEDGTWIVSGGPRDEVQRLAVDRQFRALAIRAALGADLADGPTPLDCWLNQLRRGPYFVPTEVTTEGPVFRVVEGGWINNLLIASAEYCVELETTAYARDREAPATESTEPGAVHMVGGPALAKWLYEHMEKTELTVNRLHVQSGVDAKTIKKMLAGKPVRLNMVGKLARGLSVDARDIPTN